MNLRNLGSSSQDSLLSSPLTNKSKLQKRVIALFTNRQRILRPLRRGPTRETRQSQRRNVATSRVGVLSHLGRGASPSAGGGSSPSARGGISPSAGGASAGGASAGGASAGGTCSPSTGISDSPSTGGISSPSTGGISSPSTGSSSSGAGSISSSPSGASDSSKSSSPSACSCSGCSCSGFSYSSHLTPFACEGRKGVASQPVSYLCSRAEKARACANAPSSACCPCYRRQSRAQCSSRYERRRRSRTTCCPCPCRAWEVPRARWDLRGRVSACCDDDDDGAGARQGVVGD